MGGLFERFAGLDNPWLNYDVYPPTPTDVFRLTFSLASTTEFLTFQKIGPISWPSPTRSRVWRMGT